MKYKKLIGVVAMAGLFLYAGIAYAYPGKGNSSHKASHYGAAAAGKTDYRSYVNAGVEREDSNLKDDSKLETEVNQQEREMQEESGITSSKGLKDQNRKREQITEEVQNEGLEKFRGRIRVKNKEIKFDVPPVIKSGRTLIPVRAVTEGLGATVNWDEATNTVTITKNGVTVVLILGSTEVTVNGTKMNLDVPALLISNRTFVPLRFLSEVFKEKVNYNDATGDIDVGDNNDSDIETGDIDVEEGTGETTESPTSTAPETSSSTNSTTTEVSTSTETVPTADNTNSTGTTTLPSNPAPVPTTSSIPAA
ncbi:copper amine oxidase N-terminal domain-containing protein [Neomoorella humiferrea]|uniref:Primary amine oxidase n=1 Tax=Neomoorella humiferrea TaxID=676965 RepID=A0A2T0ATN8_9FIRM|nr:copper amine oxidase N-terminal domain-containing protein [Moorella humiferrea]PRR73834.1 Primary amine oxidase precursor [Moorella humiferrea]